MSPVLHLHAKDVHKHRHGVGVDKQPSSVFIFVNFICMFYLPACMYVYHKCAWLAEVRRGG